MNQGQIIAGPGSISTGDLTISAGGRFTYNGSSLSVTNLSNSGTFIGGVQVINNFVNAASGDVRIAAGQAIFLQNLAATGNAGLIEVFGTGTSQAQFESAGPFTNGSGGGTGMIAAQNATFHFDGGLTNQGSIAFSGGISNVFGEVMNSPGGTIAISGGAGVTFYGDVVQNGMLNVSTVGGTSSAVFLGAVSGSGSVTGGGNVSSSGRFAPGDAPARNQLRRQRLPGPDDQYGDRYHGYRGGIGIRSGERGGNSGIAGSLTVTLSNPGYRPNQGTQFEILTFASCTGSFAAIDGLNLGNRLQLVPTFTSNALILTAVQGGSGTWNTDADGVISAASNWANGVPGEAGDEATFGPVISSPRTVTVDVPTTFGSMTFQSSNGYTIAGSNSITLQVPGGNPQITVLAGSHSISAPWYWPGI